MITAKQVLVGTAPTLLGAVPPGICSVVLTGGSATVYFGGSSVILASQGAPLPAGAVVTIPCYSSSQGESLYAAGTAAATNIGFTVSTGM